MAKPPIPDLPLPRSHHLFAKMSSNFVKKKPGKNKKKRQLNGGYEKRKRENNLPPRLHVLKKIVVFAANV